MRLLAGGVSVCQLIRSPRVGVSAVSRGQRAIHPSIRPTGLLGTNGTLRHYLFTALLACFTASQIALAQAPLTPEQSIRYEALLNELRCLVCQNQNLAESNAPLAEDLRREVRAQIAQGKNAAEVKQYLTARYGDFVLYRPPFKPRTWLLWLGPAVLLLLASLLAWRIFRTSAPASSPPPDPQLLRRILDEDRHE